MSGLALRQRGRRIVAQGVLLVVMVAGWFVSRVSEGESTPQLTAEAVVSALAEQDRGALERQLAPDLADRSLVADSLVEKFGGRLSSTQVTLADTESSGTKRATLTATLDGRPYVAALWLTRTRGRWFASSWDSD